MAVAATREVVVLSELTAAGDREPLPQNGIRSRPELLAAVGKADLIRLGNRVEVAREAAPSRPHRGARARPPWNKLTDALLGAADKIRDLATGR